jgi:hypothetical protein
MAPFDWIGEMTASTNRICSITDQYSISKMTNPFLEFKFVNREAEIKELTKHFENNYKIQLANEKKEFSKETTRRELSLIVVNQMYGSGKTRFGEEYLQKVKDTDEKTQFEKEIEKSIAVYIQLKNRIDLCKIPKATLEMELISLILQAYPSQNLSQKSFDWFLKQNFQVLDGFDKRPLLFQLGIYLTKYSGMSRHLYIMIDEVDELFTHF